MASEFSIKHIGNKQTQRMFAKLPEKVARKPVRKAVNAASQVTLKKFRQNLPKDTGDTKRSAAKKIVTSKDKLVITGIIGSDRKKDKGGRILHLIENGYIRKDGVFVPGKHPLKRAKESTKTERAKAFGTKLGNEIDKEAIKLGRK